MKSYVERGFELCSKGDGLVGVVGVVGEREQVRREAEGRGPGIEGRGWGIEAERGD
jgi:hypothetical protein